MAFELPHYHLCTVEANGLGIDSKSRHKKSITVDLPLLQTPSMHIERVREATRAGL